jgi:hypothetical protein
MRLCIAMFGLNRSLPWTHRSIKDNLIRPLVQYGAQVKLYAHFNIPQGISNPRSGEKVGSFKNRGVDLLPFEQIIMEPQRNEETENLLETFKQHDLQSNDPTTNTHRNLINQYHSLHAVMQMITNAEGNEVDAVLFARPDVEYLDRLNPANSLPSLLDGRFDLLTPTWQRWGGLNDRVCMCNLRAAKVYADRISIISEVIANKKPMNAESILLHTVQRNLLKNGDLSLRGVRVRATGYTVDEGLDLDYFTQLRFFKRRVVSKIRRMVNQ